MDLHCDAPNCHERFSMTDMDQEDRNRLEDCARLKGWRCVEGDHTCPECVIDRCRHLPKPAVVRQMADKIRKRVKGGAS